MVYFTPEQYKKFRKTYKGLREEGLSKKKSYFTAIRRAKKSINPMKFLRKI